MVHNNPQKFIGAKSFVGAHFETITVGKKKAVN